MIIVVCVLLVAAAATAGVLFWPKSKVSTASTTTPISSVVEPPTISATDPPVAAKAATIKAVAVTAGKVPTAAGVAKKLAPALANPGLAQYNGIVIDPTTGKVLWNKDSGTPTLPASTLKLLTGAAVLTKVDPNSRLTTKVVQGSQPGDLVIVGGGDVTLSARAAGVATVYDGAPTVADLAAQVLATGYQVKRIVYDISYWSGPELADGWQAADVPGGNVTNMQALMVDGDRTDPSNEDSARTGQPAVTAGKALARALGNASLPITAGTAPAKAKVLGSVQSQPVSTLLAQALTNSDNVLAESLARQVAKALGAPLSFEGASQATVLALQDLKLDTIGLVLDDASGVSNSDRASTELLSRVLAMAVTGKVPALRGLLTGLPVAGVSGTLAKTKGRFVNPQAKAGIGWVRAKTGSLQSTYAMAGYVPDVDGRILVFALNSSNVLPGTTPNAGRPAQDQFAAALRTCGCS